ncbi:potassium channel protein [Candidatus Poribacteria bacterium]|nr:potassium channel protein [Candidatus Poribacteria bacterium]
MNRRIRRQAALSPEQRLILVLTSVTLVLMAGVVGYMLIEGWEFLDALYMTVTTIATVGFSEVRPLSPLGRIFTIGLIVVGVGLVFYSFGLVVEMMVEGGILDILGRRRVHREIRELKDHYIICGYGRMGSVVVEELTKRKLSLIVIEIDPNKIQVLHENSVLAIYGNAGDEAVLHKAGIERARGLVAVAASDAENLFITITARGLNKDLFITSRAETSGAGKKMLQVGANKVVSPYLIGAYRLVGAILKPAVTHFIELSSLEREMDVRLEEIGVGERSSLVSKALKDTPIRSELGIIVIAVEKKDGRMVFNPPSDHVIESDDKLITIGTLEQTEKLIVMAT